MAMRLLTFPSNQDVFWVVLGWAVLYGAARALFTDGGEKSTQIFDDSPWQLGISIGWPALYWFISHGVPSLLN
jgi:hypothetical protein